MMDWLRWYHGTISDPKWRVVARKAGQCVTVRDVLCVWAAMLEHASQSDPRGHLTGWDHETAGAALDLDADQVASVYTAMQGRTLEGDMIINWKKRQPKREDSSAAERKRKQREREAEAARYDDVTQRHAPVTQSHDRAEQSRAEQSRQEQSRQEQSRSDDGRDWFDVMAQCCVAAGLPEGRAVNEMGLIGKWASLGLLPEVIISAIRAKAQMQGYRAPRGMAWFNPMLEELAKAKATAAPAQDEDAIRRNLRGWFDLGAPKASMKHPPGHPECKIPKHIQLEFKEDFERHGYQVAA